MSHDRLAPREGIDQPIPDLAPTPEEQAKIELDLRNIAIGHKLHSWWITQAQAEAEMLIPKAIEYSSYDLVLLGRVLLGLMDHPDAGDDGACAEAGCAIYAIGKAARIMGAYKDGLRPGKDSAVDLGVYARMLSYVMEKGQWP